MPTGDLVEAAVGGAEGIAGRATERKVRGFEKVAGDEETRAGKGQAAEGDILRRNDGRIGRPDANGARKRGARGAPGGGGGRR